MLVGGRSRCWTTRRRRRHRLARAAAAAIRATPAALARCILPRRSTPRGRACCDYVGALRAGRRPRARGLGGSVEALSSPLLRLLAGRQGVVEETAATDPGRLQAADADDAAGRVAPALCALAGRARPGTRPGARARASALAAAKGCV